MAHDVDRLSNAFEQGDLVRPRKDVLNVLDLFSALCRWNGLLGGEIGPGEATVLSLFEPGLPIVLVLIDGAGSHVLERLPPGSFLRTPPAHLLRSLFPSSTTAVLTSLATARWPGQHGVASWWIRLVERGLDVVSLPFVQRDTARPLRQLGMQLEDLFPIPSVWSRRSDGVSVIYPNSLVRTPFSHYSFGTHPQRGFHTLSQVVGHVINALRASPPPKLVYLYLPQFDDVAHRAGAASERALGLLSQLDRLLAELSQELTGQARLLITADHGMLDCPAEKWLLPLRSDPMLADLACQPSGEPRVPFFHVQPGKEDRFAASFRERFGEQFALLTPDDLESIDLLGPAPLSTVARDRLGTYVAVPLGDTCWSVRNNESEQAPVIGIHGGLSRVEMMVPLIAV